MSCFYTCIWRLDELFFANSYMILMQTMQTGKVSWVGPLSNALKGKRILPRHDSYKNPWVDINKYSISYSILLPILQLIQHLLPTLLQTQLNAIHTTADREPCYLHYCWYSFVIHITADTEPHYLHYCWYSTHAHITAETALLPTLLLI